MIFVLLTSRLQDLEWLFLHVSCIYYLFPPQESECGCFLATPAFSSHSIVAKWLHEAEDGQEQMPVTFRYTLTPKESMVTHAFRPKEVSSRDDNKRFKAQSLGAVFHQNYDKVISNKRASLVWEACCFTKQCFLLFIFFHVLVTGCCDLGPVQSLHLWPIGSHCFPCCDEVDFSSSPPTVVAAKPKVYLLCSLHLPARTWVNLSR